MGEAIITRRGGGGSIKIKNGQVTSGYGTISIQGLDFEPNGFVLHSLYPDATAAISSASLVNGVGQAIDPQTYSDDYPEFFTDVRMTYSNGTLTPKVYDSNGGERLFAYSTPYYWTVWRYE